MNGLAIMLISIVCFVVIVFFGLWTMMFLDVRRLSKKKRNDNGGG